MAWVKLQKADADEPGREWRDRSGLRYCLFRGSAGCAVAAAAGKVPTDSKRTDDALRITMRSFCKAWSCLFVESGARRPTCGYALRRIFRTPINIHVAFIFIAWHPPNGMNALSSGAAGALWQALLNFSVWSWLRCITKNIGCCNARLVTPWY